MCGIIGAAGKLTIKEEKMVKMMLKLDTVRGPHSTGLFGSTTGGTNDIFKKVGTPWDMEQYKQWGGFWGKTYNVIIGHNRYATAGKINAINAHPFQVGSLYGVHNGTLDNQSLLDDSRDFEVDSENIYHHMEKNGLADTVSKLDGAYALVWYDESDKTINFVRNDERTLYYCLSEDKKSIFWASEGWMIQAAAAKCDVDIGDVWKFNSDVHMSIHIESKGVYQCPDLPKPVLTKVEPYVKPVSKVWTNSYYGGNKGKKGNVTKLNDFSGSLHSYLQKDIVFRLVGIDSDNRNQDFLDCYSDSQPDIDVRIFLAGDINVLRGEQMLEDDHLYKGKVTSYRDWNGESYLVVDMRTVVTERVIEGRIAEKK